MEECYMSEYIGNWIETYTGKRFHFLDPKPEEICIKDIAHALSLKCRYSGHCKFFYSVGQHSLHVAYLLPEELKLSGLLHDAAEAYIPDIPRPIKRHYGLEEAENKIISVIADKYNLYFDDMILEVDNTMLSTEAEQLMENKDGWAPLPKPLPFKIDQYEPLFIEGKFLEQFNKYGGKEQ
jgi:hypothetical protein